MARLLFDQNLSYRLVAALADLFPGSLHVRDAGLSRADDLSVWRYAREHGLAIVTKDGDFNQTAFPTGMAPRIVWLRVGNCTTDQILGLLRREDQALLRLSSPPRRSS